MANDRLRDALMTARVTHEELAADLGVHTKTVERWITQDRTPYPQFRHRISVLVQKDETWLWPDGYSRKRRGEIGRVRDRAHLPLPGRRAPASCGPGCSRTRSTTSASWSTPGSSCPSSTHRTIELLKQKADDGASIRILLGDPDSPQVALNGQEEDIGDAIAAKIRNVLLAYYMPFASHPGISIKLHATTLYNSIFWFDDDMLVNTHVYGVPAHFAPVLHLRHLSSGTLFQTYARSFDRVWDQTRKTWTGQKGL